MTDTLRVRYPAAKLVICGDFNRLDVSDIQHQLNLTQVVDFPTHGQATLDLILTDLDHQYSAPRPLPPVVRSNHASILWSPAPTTSVPRETVTQSYRPTPDSSIREFGQWLVHHPWIEVTEPQDVHTKFHNYVNTTTEAYHHYFPTKTIRVHPADTPWMTPRIMRLLQLRNKLFYTDPAQYRSLRNRVIREIKTDKARHYPEKMQHLKQANNRQWYSKIKSLCGLQKQSPSFPCTSHLSPDNAAEELNGHSPTMFQTLSPLQTSLLPAFLPSPSPLPSPSTLPSVHEAEVANMITSFTVNLTDPPH
ncbi:hypothetical protein Pmani_005611 [Petrolisthes manimaculis]|uniref:Endonuclease/exonuclease/phosphatase domain-containing protein n=1 Tax=Petrolisthes manimaculis TaxID=1843537 RepID=A0AAE1QBC3_9EUCA|nr:hypothetical protein Pmani_005611 [Petrolisthes manimaculis]